MSFLKPGGDPTNPKQQAIVLDETIMPDEEGRLPEEAKIWAPTVSGDTVKEVRDAIGVEGKPKAYQNSRNRPSEPKAKGG